MLRVAQRFDPIIQETQEKINPTEESWAGRVRG